MLVASDRELASAFGWPPATARAALEELVDCGEAVLEAGAYRPGA
jgi:DNA-binding GntR family transcriptional regulator